jgi:hypothetical protein
MSFAGVLFHHSKSLDSRGTWQDQTTAPADGTSSGHPDAMPELRAPAKSVWDSSR